MEANEALIAILKKSHAQAMAGQAVTMDEVEHFMSDRISQYGRYQRTYFTLYSM